MTRDHNESFIIVFSANKAPPFIVSYIDFNIFEVIYFCMAFHNYQRKNASSNYNYTMSMRGILEGNDHNEFNAQVLIAKDPADIALAPPQLKSSTVCSR